MNQTNRFKTAIILVPQNSTANWTLEFLKGNPNLNGILIMKGWMLWMILAVAESCGENRNCCLIRGRIRESKCHRLCGRARRDRIYLGRSRKRSHHVDRTRIFGRTLSGTMWMLTFSSRRRPPRVSRPCVFRKNLPWTKWDPGKCSTISTIIIAAKKQNRCMFVQTILTNLTAFRRSDCRWVHCVTRCAVNRRSKI